MDAIPMLNLTHLRLKGPDAERYLNGQITQQIAALAEGESRYTFVCDAKGRILFDGFVHRDAEGFLLSVDGGDSSEIFTRMDRYLIADDCELSDESEQWGLLHDPAGGGKVNRFGSNGRDLYCTGSKLAALKSQAASSPSPAKLEDLRISHAVPRMPDLLGALPAETGKEEEAISFHKGCYLGQEVISRMKRAGRTNRKLVPVLLSETSSELPLAIHAPDSEKTMLEITSVASSPSETGFPALGYLSSKYEPGTALQSVAGIKVLSV